MNIIDQLIEVYHNKEPWHKKKLSKTESRKYFNKMIDKGCIIWETNEGNLIGYVEFWKINMPQLRNILFKTFSAYEENVNSGDICYVANTWIHEDHRNKNTYKLLKNRLLTLNKDCDYFVGENKRRFRIHRSV